MLCFTWFISVRGDNVNGLFIGFSRFFLICEPSKQTVPTSKRTPRKNTTGSNEVGEEWLKTLKLQCLEKRRIRNDLILTHKIIYNKIDPEATQLFKFSRRPGLRRSALRLLQQTRQPRRRRNSFACKVVKYWNRLPLLETSVPNQLVFKKQLDTYIYP